MPKISRFVYWTPRILAIVFILFLAMFSLDIFDNNYTFWEIVLGLFMHNIPTFILLIVLLISWRYEIVGAVAFILAGILYIVWLLMSQKLEWYMLFWVLQIAGPTFLVGILFWVNWKKRKQVRKKIKKKAN